MNLSESIQNLKQEMSHSGVHQEEGLGTELFHFASTLMPVINVDIIVTNQHDQFFCLGTMIPTRELGGMFLGDALDLVSTYMMQYRSVQRKKSIRR